MVYLLVARSQEVDLRQKDSHPRGKAGLHPKT